jgi:Yip1 domain
MLKQLLQNSDAILRRPTVTSFQQINVDNWRWSFIYLAIGTVLTILINTARDLLFAPAIAPALEQQNLELTKSLGSGYLASLLANMLNPSYAWLIGILNLFLGIVFLILLPYWLGQAFGGPAGFGNFAYHSSLFIAPLAVLDSVIGISLGKQFGGLAMLLSLSLYVFCFYLVYVNLRATMGLSKAKSALVAFIPILIAGFLLCVLVLLVTITALSQ